MQDVQSSRSHSLLSKTQRKDYPMQGGTSEDNKSVATCCQNCGIALPNLATPILNELRAKVLEEAAEYYHETTAYSIRDNLRRMAQEYRK